jgi:hypothetical protein
MQDPMGNSTARSAGDVWDGLSNGIATGFGGDALIPELAASAYTPVLTVAASAGGDLATPVAYWFQRYPLRVRVGSTGAAAIPATSGLRRTVTEAPNARGVLRLGLGDVDAAAQMILDQGTNQWIKTDADFEVHFDVANVSNGTILAVAGFADLGVFGGAVGVNPAAVANAVGFYFKIGAGKIKLISTATTDTVIGTLDLPAHSFVLSIRYDSFSRRVFGLLDGEGFSATSVYTLPASVTSLAIGARVCHLAAYSAATDAPLIVDLDGIVSTQLSSSGTTREKLNG